MKRKSRLHASFLLPANPYPALPDHPVDRLYLFIGDAEAGETTAIYYTLIESARRRGLDPQAYLHDILRRRPITPLDQIHTLTPAAWAKAQQKKAA